jgi:hypothetical protein
MHGHMNVKFCEISGFSWFYYKENRYDARSHERKIWLPASNIGFTACSILPFDAWTKHCAVQYNTYVQNRQLCTNDKEVACALRGLFSKELVLENARNITEVARCSTIQRVCSEKPVEGKTGNLFFFSKTQTLELIQRLFALFLCLLRRSDLSRGKGKGKVKVCSP